MSQRASARAYVSRIKLLIPAIQLEKLRLADVLDQAQNKSYGVCSTCGVVLMSTIAPFEEPTEAQKNCLHPSVKIQEDSDLSICEHELELLSNIVEAIHKTQESIAKYQVEFPK
jgi:ferredoxin